MNTSLKIKIAGICGEIKTQNSDIHTYLKSKLIHFSSQQRRIDFEIEIDKKSTFSSQRFQPHLAYRQGIFHILPYEQSKTTAGIIDLDAKLCRISEFEDKSKLLHSVFLCYALFLENSGRIILHASAAYKDGQGYLFPGPANSGKSTILKQIKEFAPLAEEWVAVKKTGNDFFMWSLPYQEALNKKKKVQRILFPKKGKALGSKKLETQEALKRLLANCLFSTMHPEIVGSVLERIIELGKSVRCYELEFPLGVCLDEEIEQPQPPEEKQERKSRINLPKDLELSSLHESLILTWECNLRCHHCRPFLPRDGTPRFSDVKKYLNTLAQKGSLFLHLTGGEPLVHKDFWKIVSHASQKNFALILNTNGTLITPEVGDKLKNFNFVQVALTVLGGKAQTHDSITGVKGSFAKTMRALTILKEKELDVVLSTTKLMDNQEEIPEMERLAKNQGVSFKSIPYQPPNIGEFEEFSRCYLKNFQRS
jgi:uncharacterized Fe-S cluster-containing radical SAM superfamily protein